MADQIKNGKVVGISYTLRDTEGNILDQSAPGEPLEYLHGNQNIIPGLESQLEGMEVGDKKVVDVAAKDGYGEYQQELLFKVPKANFPPDVNLEEGMEFQASTENGPMIVKVQEIDNDFVIVDANHPLAGQDLQFDVKVDSIRDSTEQERSHGHVHSHGHDH